MKKIKEDEWIFNKETKQYINTTTGETYDKDGFDIIRKT